MLQPKDAKTMANRRWCGRMIATALILLASSTSARAAGIPWETDLDKALAKAALGQRLLLVHFWDESCPPCRRVEKEVFRHPDVIRFVGLHFIPVKINVSQQPAVRQRFNVRAWPTDVVLDPRGRELYRGVPRPDPRHFVATLTNVSAHARLRRPIQRSDPGSNWQDPRRAVREGAASGSPYAANPMPRNTSFQPPGAAVPRSNGPTAATPPASAPPKVVTNRFAAPGNPVPAPSRQAPVAQAPVAQAPVGPPPPAQPPMAAAPGPMAAAPSYGRQVAPATPPQAPVAPAPGNARGTSRTASAHVGSNDDLTVSPGDAASIPNLGLDGYCPVALVEEETWKKGDVRFGARHRGKTYLFADAEAQKAFFADPDRYAPMLSGLDVVRLVDRREYVGGKRATGFVFRDRVYLFADQASVDAFLKRPDYYHLQAMAILRRAQQNQRTQQTPSANP